MPWLSQRSLFTSCHGQKAVHGTELQTRCGSSILIRSMAFDVPSAVVKSKPPSTLMRSPRSPILVHSSASRLA
eukprot:6354145-Alexandrium_andersonii.AAC.1